MQSEMDGYVIDKLRKRVAILEEQRDGLAYEFEKIIEVVQNFETAMKTEQQHLLSALRRAEKVQTIFDA